MKWQKVGDSCSKEFFGALKAHTGASQLTKLEDEGGNLCSDQAGLEEVCSRYYGNLYSKLAGSAVETVAAAQSLSCSRDRLSGAMKSALRKPTSLQELEAALKDMDPGKAPGPDGVLTEFFKVYWNVIKLDYHRMITQAVALQRLPAEVRKGLISLLHKGDVRRHLTNSRPITLLNVAYKLLTKVLQLRLQPVLMEVIDYDRSVFLPLRFILDNILLTHETMALAEHTNQPLIFLRLDFSKAYDRVDWCFLFGAMVKLGIPGEFIAMTRLFFQDAQASVKVNGSESPLFAIGAPN